MNTNILRRNDMFAQRISTNFKGKDFWGTKIGGLVSLGVQITFIVQFGFLLNRLVLY
jgi:hypothetical protein